jgi:hypothetical protein
MYLDEIVENTLHFSANFTKEGFIYELLEAYGLSKSNITKMSQSPTPFLMTNKVNFKQVEQGTLESAIEDLKKDPLTKKKKLRFLIATDFTRILAVDTKINEVLDIAVEDFFEEYGFFLPWTGREKVQVYEEVEADQKAAQKMAKLFDLIRIENTDSSPEFIEALNHFFTRLIFCFYAEDTGIFKIKSCFTSYVESHTDYHGSNIITELSQIFKVLNTSNNKNYPNKLQVFPYVNGGLFEEDYKIPLISARARRMLIECGKLDWRRINPDIFGSMFQGVMDEDIRHELGAHYTSVPNIMKVVNPLFMDNLREDFEKCKGSEKKLKELQQRISNIKIFDPACGSGNFLITAYKELRHLEMSLIEEIGKITGPQLGCLSFMTVDHFYGIEINLFAVELAKLSIWLAEHQMNVEFQDKFSVTVPSIPLKNSAKIVAANACRIDWEKVCQKKLKDEVYILGNPPYLGARLQNTTQKEDTATNYLGSTEYKDSDYISSWFLKASKYIVDQVEAGFVSTNSICQGDHVSLLWPHIYTENVEISFAHTSFLWSNNARDKAGVTCVIIGLKSLQNEKPKKLFSHDISYTVKNINPYLTNGPNVIVKQTRTSISNLPKMSFGSMPRDGGNLIFSPAEKESMLVDYPQTIKLFKKFIGSSEFIRNDIRWCLWIRDEDLTFAETIPPIEERIQNVFKFRTGSSAKTTNGYASISHKIAQRAHKDSLSIIIPRHSSARREYIPIGFLNKDTVIADSANAIYNAEGWIFTILTSRMHMTWMKVTCGRIKSDYRYSSGLCYNTFPIPSIKDSQKEILEELSFNILEARDMHPGKALAQLYDPDKMPQNLRDAHHELDLAVDAIYRKEPFKNDEERLVHLFKLYEKMTSGEKK